MTDEELAELALGNYGFGRCRNAVLELAAADRSLTVVRGYADETEHWWLQDPDGNIVDPTADQFERPPTYRPLAVGVPAVRPPLLYRCTECGAAHDGDLALDFCSEACADAFESDLNMGWQ